MMSSPRVINASWKRHLDRTSEYWTELHSSLISLLNTLIPRKGWFKSSWRNTNIYSHDLPDNGRILPDKPAAAADELARSAAWACAAPAKHNWKWTDAPSGIELHT